MEHSEYCTVLSTVVVTCTSLHPVLTSIVLQYWRLEYSSEYC